jgi:hypothetical protein
MTRAQLHQFQTARLTLIQEAEHSQTMPLLKLAR